jgi:AAA15 family ATPase/GTPase
MLSKLKVQHYKSLFDTEVDLEPLTVFIGPNGSGKSNICEALAILSDFLQRLIDNGDSVRDARDIFQKSLQAIDKNRNDNLDLFVFEVNTNKNLGIKNSSSKKKESFKPISSILLCINYLKKEIKIEIFEFEKNSISDYFSHHIYEFLISHKYLKSPVEDALRKVSFYDFTPVSLSSNVIPKGGMERTGQGIAYALVDILHLNRNGFDELEERLVNLVPNIKSISLPRSNNEFSLELIDRYSDHHIPASDISDGTLRILAFLTALYQKDTPSIICFEEIENGVHPWLLHKMMELLKIVSTEGITGKPVQVLITTHSPVLLNYVEPHQVRAVELDAEGKTQVHALPIDSVRFQKALEAYDGSLGELWFTNMFGGNPV